MKENGEKTLKVQGPMKLGYLLLVHKNPHQFERLLRAIYDPDNAYLIHADLKSGRSFVDEIERIIKPYPRAWLMKPMKCYWCGWSTVLIEREAIRQWLERADDGSFFINLSGQDFPLKTQAQLKEFLGRNARCNFLEINPGAEKEWVVRDRTRRYYLEVGRKIKRVPLIPAIRRLDVPLYKGSQWVALSRSFCEYLGKADLRKYDRFFNYSFVPDESFFHTVLMNSPLADTHVNDNLRKIIWPPGGSPQLLTSRDYDALTSSGKYFARKFDETADGQILDRLESLLREEDRRRTQ